MLESSEELYKGYSMTIPNEKITPVSLHVSHVVTKSLSANYLISSENLCQTENTCDYCQND